MDGTDSPCSAHKRHGWLEYPEYVRKMAEGSDAAAVGQLKEMFPDLDEEILTDIYVQSCNRNIDAAIDTCFSFMSTPEDQVRQAKEVRSCAECVHSFWIANSLDGGRPQCRIA
jgi:hypothetical protein